MDTCFIPPLLISSQHWSFFTDWACSMCLIILCPGKLYFAVLRCLWWTLTNSIPSKKICHGLNTSHVRVDCLVLLQDTGSHFRHYRCAWPWPLMFKHTCFISLMFEHSLFIFYLSIRIRVALIFGFFKSSALTLPVNCPLWEIETNQISLRLDCVWGVLKKEILF